MDTLNILGVGKLGLCFALNAEQAGYSVLGVDINQSYVDALNNKSFYSHEPQVNELLQKAENFKATTQLKDVINSNSPLIFILVATPTDSEGGYDHHQVERVVEQIMAFGQSAMQRHVIIGCTTMPGYCDTLAERLAPYNYTVTYNPEFIAQGNVIHDQQYPDQVLIGTDNEDAAGLLSDVYKAICKNEPTYCVMSRISAEICKLATNCFLTTKISFANSIGDLATKAGAEPDKILAAIGADSRIGGKYLRYGFGFGGPCFPRDNRALGKFANGQNYPLLISEATDEVNKRHLTFQVNDYLMRYDEEEVIVFDHVSYKKGSVLIEESQQLALAVALAKQGRKVLVKDKQAVIEQVKELHGTLLNYEVTD